VWASAALPLVAASCASTTPTTKALYGAFDARSLSTDPVSTGLSGVKLGFEERSVEWPVTPLLEVGYLVAPSEDLQLFAFSFGVRRAALSRGPLELGGLGLIDMQVAKLDRFQNANLLLGVGIGAYAKVRIGPNIELGASASAGAFGDATLPTTCNDGSMSASTGQGTCSHHDGIAFYNDQLGGGFVLEALVVAGFLFGGNEP
jgi:hypothetical protein